MATYEQIYQATRRNGFSHEDADREARIYADRAPAPPPPPPDPAQPAEWERRWDAGRRREASWLASLGNAAQDAADDARDEAEIKQIDAEIERLAAPLHQRRAAAVARIEQRRRY